MRKKLLKERAVGRSLGASNPQNYAGSGYLLQDDLLSDLTGSRGALTYRQMSDGSPIIGAVLYCIQMFLEAVQWRLDTDSENATADAMVSDKDLEFLNSVLFEDTEQPFNALIADAVSMLTYGFSISEVAYKIRTEDNSLFPDGRIGIDRTIHIPQESVYKWRFDDEGRLIGFEQSTNTASGIVFIPIEKCIHFKAPTSRGTPEGRSVLRNAYRPWYFARNIERIEAVGIERELAGLPVVTIPNEILEKARGGDTDSQKVLNSYLEVSKNVRLNEQAGLVLPSDTYLDADDKPTNIPLVELKLLASSGTRAIDTNTIVNRHESNIARSMMADFIMLGTAGSGGGAYSLGKDKSTLFENCLNGWLSIIQDTIQRQLVKPLWLLNGMDMNVIPQVSHTPLLRESLVDFASSIQKLAAAGMALFPSEDMESYIRSRHDWPTQTEEEIERASALEEEVEEDLDE